MAVYKVIQDIEAEDKLLGPLTLRQFIYAIVVVVSLFMAYRLVLVQPVLAIPLLPIIIFFGALAAPLGGAQSSEVWLLAKIRFFLLPRRKIWNQDGIQELVTITVPKVIEKILTKDFSQTEVESRLQALANTIDSRGWAVKNVDTSMYAQPVFGGSQRLMQANTIPQDPGYDATSSDDMLDEQSNPRARQLEQLIQQSAQTRRQEIIDRMQQPVAVPNAQATQQAVAAPATTATPPPTTPADYWFLDPTAAQQQAAAAPVQAQATNTPPQRDAITTAPDEQALLDRIHADQHHPVGTENLPTLRPIDTQQPLQATTKPPVTAKPDPAILEFANNDDLNVATIQRQANKPNDKDQPRDGEVVISLH